MFAGLNHVLFGLEQSPFLFYCAAFVFGACIGSFLNVVIYRLPVMMEREFKESCEEYFECTCESQTEGVNEKIFTLSKPRSRCPGCGRQIKAWENLPIISYLLMRGKCTGCKQKISIQYPLVELFVGLLSVALAIKFGVSLQFLAAFAMTAALVAMSGIDIKVQLLPDSMTLPFLWLGLLISLIGGGLFVDPQTAIVGAALGYLSLWSVYHIFKLATGKEGMGYGDFKLLAMLGAWMGASMLPLIIILSALAGSVIGLGLIVFQGRDKATPLPFGPYLAIAGWIAFLWGDRIMSAYLSQF